MMTAAEHSKEMAGKLTIRYFLLLFIPVALILCGFLTTIFVDQLQGERSKLKLRQMAQLQTRQQIVSEVFYTIVSDLLFLSELENLKIRDRYQDTGESLLMKMIDGNSLG